MKKKLFVTFVAIMLLCLCSLVGCNNSATNVVDKNVYGGSGDTPVEIYIYTDEGRLVWGTTCLRRDYTLEAYQSSYVLTIRRNGETRYYVGGIIAIIEHDSESATVINN